MKKLCLAVLSVLVLSSVVNAQYLISTTYADNDYNYKEESRYDYVYYNPPRQSLGAWGRYIYTNSKVRYVHSPSKLKRAAHAARINAYNYEYGNY